ncbi:restriction endonuclease subunit S [Nocardiopsis sp. EMB25]|uniref:restriction endonuclease subunit S n=1 Tax=Nocardiopsis sp. EMB25 TaxID=2835867 RepID=UPI0022837C47|nr:restriction endonuclease subunit S [Nocardiopsis sp. EMB25]MCY9786963.1 restriction endonuclease subunit S [Nocardiopsis sp. EMB25]
MTNIERPAWLASLPSYWNVAPGKTMTKLIQRPASEGDGIVTAFRDGKVTLRANRRMDGFTEAIQEIGYQGVRAGELVIHSMDGFAGAIGVSDSDGKMSPVVHIYRTPDDDPYYIAHTLRVAAQAGFIQSLAKGIRERSTSFDKASFKSMLLPRPPRAEQGEIVAYIDRETAQIDTLIADQQRLIEMLRERRQAMIDHAFGSFSEKGIQLRRFIRFLTSGSRGWGEYYADSGDVFVRIGNLPRGSLSLRGEVQRVDLPPNVYEGQRARLKVGDLLFSITAYIGSVAVADQEWADSYVSQHVALCRIDMSVLDPKFTGYFMLTTKGQNQLSGGALGGTKVQLALDDIKALRVPVPSLNEQQQIVERLAQETSRIDNLIAESERLIELSQERRSALITAAVTGQIDVRQEA